MRAPRWRPTARHSSFLRRPPANRTCEVAKPGQQTRSRSGSILRGDAAPAELPRGLVVLVVPIRAASNASATCDKLVLAKLCHTTVRASVGVVLQLCMSRQGDTSQHNRPSKTVHKCGRRIPARRHTTHSRILHRHLLRTHPLTIAAHMFTCTYMPRKASKTFSPSLMSFDATSRRVALLSTASAHPRIIYSRSGGSISSCACRCGD